MDQKQMLDALKSLDARMKQAANLLLGGGGAMVLAHGFPLATQDLDGLFYQSDIDETDLAEEIQEVARELKLPSDWLNSYFQSFLYTLPRDYASRFVTVYHGGKLSVQALGLEDLLILKCFAGREKDLGHARALIKKGANLIFVEKHIAALEAKNIPKARDAADFLQDLIDEVS